MKILKKSAADYFVFIILLFCLGCRPTIGNPNYSPDGQAIVLALNSQIYRISPAGGKALRVSNSKSYDFDPVYTPDGHQIVFASAQEGKKSDLWIMNLDGSRRIQLTNGLHGDKKPCISKDGQKIYFLRERKLDGETFSNELDIYSIEINGSNLKEIVKTDEPVGFTPSISPDGKYLLLGGTNIEGGLYRNALRMLPLENPQATQYIKPEFDIEPMDKWMTGITETRFSPNGKSVLFLWYMYNEHKEHKQIYVMDLENRKAKKIVEFSDYLDYPSFSPDGKKIIFATGLFNYNPDKLWVVNVDGTDLHQISIKK